MLLHNRSFSFPRLEVDSAPGRGTTIVLNHTVVAADVVAREAAARDARASAAVSLRDRRIAACFEALLASAGFTVLPQPVGGPGPVVLWVTEPCSNVLKTARVLRAANPRCWIVVYGRASNEWRALQVVTVTCEGSLGTLREALAQAIAAKT